MAGAYSVRRELERLRSRGFAPAGILDIGAHDGDFSRDMRSIFPDSHIVMVDALEEKRPALEKTREDIGNCTFDITLLGDVEIDAVPFFVVDREKRPDLVTTGSSKFQENNNFPVIERAVRQDTLANVIRKSGSVPYQFLKLDVQGAELQVLSGIGSYLSDVEVIMSELSVVNYNKGAPIIGDVLAALSAMGFVLWDIVHDHRFGDDLFQLDGLFVRPDSRFRAQPPFN